MLKFGYTTIVCGCVFFFYFFIFNFIFFFFFKQKTAYEIYQCDWSSDVCSSDLLSVRFIKCNKPGCRCAEDPKARHGPYTSVVRTVDKRSRSRLVSAEHTEILRAQLEAGQQFRQDVERYWQVCEDWADVELNAGTPTAEAEKKRGSKRPLPRKSSRKSTR